MARTARTQHWPRAGRPMGWQEGWWGHLVGQWAAVHVSCGGTRSGDRTWSPPPGPDHAKLGQWWLTWTTDVVATVVQRRHRRWWWYGHLCQQSLHNSLECSSVYVWYLVYHHPRHFANFQPSLCQSPSVTFSWYIQDKEIQVFYLWWTNKMTDIWLVSVDTGWAPRHAPVGVWQLSR